MGTKKEMCAVLCNNIYFLILVKHFAYKKYFQLSKLFNILRGCFPFPTPVSVCGTSSFPWRISLIAVRHRPVNQLAVTYVVLFQLLFHFIHGLFVRERPSIRHISRHCNQIVDRFKIPWLVITNLCLINVLLFLLVPHITPASPPPLHFPIPPSYLQIFSTNIHLVIRSVR